MFYAYPFIPIRNKIRFTIGVVLGPGLYLVRDTCMRVTYYAAMHLLPMISVLRVVCSDWLGTWGGTQVMLPGLEFFNKNTPVAIVV